MESSNASKNTTVDEMETGTRRRTRAGVQFSEPSSGTDSSHTLRLRCDTEKDWIRAVCTLLPSNRGDSSTDTHGVWSLLSPSVAHTVTLPRRPGMDPRDNIVINLRRQLSNASHRKRIRPKSARLPRPSHSFRFLSKTTGVEFEGAGDATDYISLPSDGEDNESVSLEQDQWEHLLAIPSMPVPMAEKRRLRTRLQQTQVSPATGLSALELNKQKARKRLKETWKDITGRFYIWSQSMKTIEGRYGTGVVSYFIFLRWLLFLNVFICALVLSFIVLPQALAKHNTFTFQNDNNSTIPNTSASPQIMDELPHYTRSKIYEGTKLLAPEELRHISYTNNNKANADIVETTIMPQPNVTELSAQECYGKYKEAVASRTRHGIEGAQDFLQGTGFMEITILFPGYYDANVPNILDTKKPYNLSLAYIFVTVVYFLVCLVMMVIYTSEGVHETLKTSEGQLHKYCNLVFGGWDYCIEQKKTAIRKHQSITQELKSTLFEKRRQNEVARWSRKTQFVVFLTRCLLHIVVIAILSGAGYGIYTVCVFTLNSEQTSRGSNDFQVLLIEFLPSITITLLNIILPIIFNLVAKFEKYSVAFTIKITLVRTVFVRLASVGVLVWTFYQQFTCKDSERDRQCNFCSPKDKTLSPRCWETYVGQQIYKLVILDFIVVLVTTFLIDFPRRLIYTSCSCKLAKVVGPLEFDIPKHVLDLVYSQTLCWLGTFYSPLLPAICVIKYIVFFYLKKLTLLVNCSPSQIPYRASKSNTFFMIVLMLSFVLSVIPVGYTIAEIPPSKGCGPFRGTDFTNMWDPVRLAVDGTPSPFVRHALNYLASAGFAVPLFVVFCLLIYYYSTVSSAHKDMIKVLKDQLILEGKDKQFLLARLTEDAKQRLRSGGSFAKA